MPLTPEYPLGVFGAGYFGEGPFGGEPLSLIDATPRTAPYVTFPATDLYPGVDTLPDTSVPLRLTPEAPDPLTLTEA